MASKSQSKKKHHLPIGSAITSATGMRVKRVLLAPVTGPSEPPKDRGQGEQFDPSPQVLVGIYEKPSLSKDFGFRAHLQMAL